METNHDYTPDMDDFYTALHQEAKSTKGGISGIARKLGMTPKTLINYLAPYDETHQPRVNELVATMHNVGDVSVALDVFCQMFGYSAKTHTLDRCEDMYEAAMIAINEVTDISRRLIEFKDGSGALNANEKLMLRKEIQEAERALAMAKNTLNTEV